MQVRLKSTNYEKPHAFNFVVREDEILITTSEGNVIATLQVETMESCLELTQPPKPTENFFLTFIPEDASSKNSALAWVEKP